MEGMKSWEERTAMRLRAHLQRRVPPAIRAYKRCGGPHEEDYARVRSYATDIGSFGDMILFPNGKGDDQPHLDKLVDGVAVLAFCPGGVRLFGIHFEATKFDQEQDEDQDELGQLLVDIDRILGLSPLRRRYENTKREQKG